MSRHDMSLGGASHDTSPSTRSGCRSANRCATMPPSECPNTTARSQPTASSTAAASSTTSSDVYGTVPVPSNAVNDPLRSPGRNLVDAPVSRWSYRTTSKPSSANAWHSPSDHQHRETASPITSRSGTPPPGPNRS